MASPFPGMDPYLEDPNIWPGFHHYLADEFVAQLNSRIGPRYFADVNVRTVFEEVSITMPRTTIPDVGIVEQSPLEMGPIATATPIAPAPVRRTILLRDQVNLRAVHVHLTETGELVTTIEILSPYNKRVGDGLVEYRGKRSKTLRSPVHLVEIDLLRGGERPGREVTEPPLETDYILLVNRSHGGDVRESEIWPVALNESLPVLPIPLNSPDPDVSLDLNEALGVVYGRSAYDRRVSYRRPEPPPELRPAMAEWLTQNMSQIGIQPET